jgi:hypothetical protein
MEPRVGRQARASHNEHRLWQKGRELLVPARVASGSEQQCDRDEDHDEDQGNSVTLTKTGESTAHASLHGGSNDAEAELTRK